MLFWRCHAYSEKNVSRRIKAIFDEKHFAKDTRIVILSTEMRSTQVTVILSLQFMTFLTKCVILRLYVEFAELHEFIAYQNYLLTPRSRHKNPHSRKRQ